MKKIINFFRGSVLFTVTGAFPERFLNLCAQNGAAFWDLVWLDAHTLKLRFSRRDSRRVAALAEKVMCEARAEGRAGVPYFLAKFKRRYALLTGLALSAAAVCLLSRFVLTVEVTGNEKVPTAAILTELSRAGVRVGTYGPAIDEKGVSHQVLLNLPDLSWMAVNLHGTRAEVLVREKLPRPDLWDESTPAQVVSKATGIITHMEVLEGQPLYREGDTVLEGDVLISGVMDLLEPSYGQVDAGTRTVHARGNVYARTWRTLQARIPLTARVKTHTGEEQRRYSLALLGRCFSLFGGAGGPDCDKTVSTHCLTLPGGERLPLALTVETYRAYTTAPVPVDLEEAQKLLEQRLLARLEGLVGDGEILRAEYTARQWNGVLTVTLLAECEEQIGRERPLE